MPRQRLEGQQETIPPSIRLVNLKGKWTEESAYQSTLSWIKLMSAQKTRIDLICARNDAMAIGAKKAMKELASDIDHQKVSTIPAMGCNGVPGTGQVWVRTGSLSATEAFPPVDSLKPVSPAA